MKVVNQPLRKKDAMQLVTYIFDGIQLVVSCRYNIVLTNLGWSFFSQSLHDVLDLGQTLDAF